MKTEYFNDIWSKTDSILEENQQRIELAKNHKRNQKDKRRKEKILLIENDSLYMEELSGTLSECGYHVDIVTDLRHAGCSDGKYIAIFVRAACFHFNMYYIDRLNGKTSKPNIHVLILEEDCTDENRIYFLNRGANDLLSIPLNKESIVEKLNEELSRSGSA